MSAAYRPRFARHLAAALLGALALLTLVPARADYPDRPITLVVPYGAGGGTDLLARLLAEQFSARFGQSVIVENVPGAGGTIGTRRVMNAKADGYTLLLGSGSELELMQITDPGAKLGQWTPLAPVGLIGTQPMVLVGRATLPAKNTDELVALLRAQPGRFSYASAGVGTQLHILGELLKMSAKLEVTHVPYKGAGPILADLEGDHVDLAVMVLPSVLSQIRSGKIIAYGISDTHRSAAAPEIATLSESQAFGNVDMKLWYGLFGPAGLPAPVIDKLDLALREALKQPLLRQKMLDMAITEAADPSAARLLEVKQAGLEKIRTVFKAIR